MDEKNGVTVPRELAVAAQRLGAARIEMDRALVAFRSRAEGIMKRVASSSNSGDVDEAADVLKSIVGAKAHGRVSTWPEWQALERVKLEMEQAGVVIAEECTRYARDVVARREAIMREEAAK